MRPFPPSNPSRLSYSLLLLLALIASPQAGSPRGVSAAEFRVEKAVAYLPVGRDEKGDLYIPTSDGGPLRPAIVVLHGGGWVSEARDSNREVNIAENLALHGFVAFSIDYKLALEKDTNVGFPQNVQDCKSAVRWLRANAARYRIDPDHLGAIGGSAGGHLAAMLAVTGPECGLEPTGYLDEFPSRVQAAVNMYGPVDIENWRDIQVLRKTRAEAPELYKAFSVLTYITPDDSPILTIQGTVDDVTPMSQAEALASKMKEQGVPHRLEVVEGAGHSFDLQPDQADLRPLVFSFFDEQLRAGRP